MGGLALTREQSREIDRRATTELGISSMVLMENAGRGVADVLLQIDPAMAATASDAPPPEVAIFCGKGNNAGDGFVIARHLEIRGARPRVLLLAPPSELGGDALGNFEILTHTDVPIVDLSTANFSVGGDLESALQQNTALAAWLVDAMLGTGAAGEPREPIRTVIEWMNRQPTRRLAVDMPSGLDCDTGQPARQVVHADITCTFVAPKSGFQTAAAQAFLGQVHVVSIGTPPWLARKVSGEKA